MAERDMRPWERFEIGARVVVMAGYSSKVGRLRGLAGTVESSGGPAGHTVLLDDDGCVGVAHADLRREVER
jgi:hypothetical protein